MFAPLNKATVFATVVAFKASLDSMLKVLYKLDFLEAPNKMGSPSCFKKSNFLIMVKFSSTVFPNPKPGSITQ